MIARKRVLSLRTTADDVALIEQAAAQQGVRISAWMRDALRERALAEVYAEGSRFPGNPGETALLRAVLVILQILNRNVAEDDQRRFAERAAREIARLKSGE